jgi:hypothetical protein
VSLGKHVELLECGHPSIAGQRRLCRHLVGEAGEDLDRVWLLTGVGIQYDVCCAACDAADEPVELIVACEGCVDRVDVDHGVTAIRGEPGIAGRPEPVDASLVATRMPVAPLDLAAVPDRPDEWLLLDRGRVLRWNAGTGQILRSARLRPPVSGVDKPWNDRQPRLRVHAAPGGRFAAVVVDYGRHGLMLDLDRDQITMQLDRGTYHPETTPYPVTFAAVDGELVLVHATDWNRLDLSDPATGALLTPRTIASPTNDEPRPAHDLDYFHGRLHLSPGGRWIADDGWVWAPVGVPRLWNLYRWRLRNPFESEDGSSAHSLCQRDYHWDSPMCWIGEDRLAISGIGGDDLALISGVRIFDPVTGAETARFAGPSGPLHSDGTRLYSATPTGLHIWDPDTGHRTGQIPGFSPTHHHPASHELAASHDTTLLRWRLRP